MFGKTSRIIVIVVFAVFLRIIVYTMQFILCDDLVQTMYNSEKTYPMSVEVNKIQPFGEDTLYLYITIKDIKCPKNFLFNSLGGVIKVKRTDYIYLLSEFKVKTLQHYTFCFNGQFVGTEELKNPGQVDPILRRLGNGSIGKIKIVSNQTAQLVSLNSMTNISIKFLLSIDSLREKLLVFLTKKIVSIYHQPTQGIVMAMLLSNRESVDEQIKDLYQEQGIVHIIAISGLHVGFLFLAIDCMLKLTIHSIKARCLICLFFLLTYNYIIGFNISALRATSMLVVYSFSVAYERPYFNKISLFGVGSFFLIFFPQSLYQGSFLLSYGAVFGLFFLHPRLKNHLSTTFKFKFKNCFIAYLCQEIISLVSISLSVNLITIPILVYFFGGLSLTSLLANVLVVPILLVFYLMILISVFLGCIHEGIGRVFSLFSMLMDSYIQGICKLCDHIPYNYILLHRPNIIEIVAYYILIILMFLSMSKEREQNDYF